VSDVLVLNADMRPMSFLPLTTQRWEDAISAVLKGSVYPVEFYDDWEVRSPSTTLKVPSVVAHTEYIHVDHRVKFTTFNLYLRDKFTCAYCKKCFYDDREHLTYDHVIPASHGGKTSWTNIVAACRACNTKKGNKLNFFKLDKKPEKPTYWDLLKNLKEFPRTVPHPTWEPYLELQ
jgi:5-methylcytosine-specific restriction endonuclease McrA